jgi:hypothetical protein
MNGNGQRSIDIAKAETDDPEKEHIVEVTVRIPVFGRRRHHASTMMQLVRAVHHGVRPGCTFVYEGRAFQFDAVLDDGHQGSDYVPRGVPFDRDHPQWRVDDASA